jgi:hypothetical protein
MKKKQPHTITKEQLQKAALAFEAADATGNLDEYIQESHKEFLDTHDFNIEASRSAKLCTSYSKKEILLEAWDQFIACEEAFAEQGFGMHAYEYFGEMRRIDLVKNFVVYLEGYVSSFDEPCDSCKKEIENVEKAENLMHIFKPNIGLA